MKARRRPAFSSARSPSVVVPAGDVTWLRRSAGCLPVTWAYVADPRIVWVTMRWATSRRRPIWTGAAIHASLTRQTEGGAGVRGAQPCARLGGRVGDRPHDGVVMQRVADGGDGDAGHD